MPAISNGMILVKPSSIDYSGASATLNNSGSVNFSACSTISINNIFSSSFDFYVVSFLYAGNATGLHNIRLRSQGTDDATNNYYYQFIRAYDSSVEANRTPQGVNVSSASSFVTSSTGGANGDQLYISNPYLLKPTFFRSVNVASIDGAWMQDYSNIHYLSNSYDGLTIISTSGTLSGSISVYGLRQ